MPWPLYFSPEKQHIFIDFIGNRSFKLPVYSQIFFNVKIILNYYMIEMISTWFQPFHQSEARALKRRFKLFDSGRSYINNPIQVSIGILFDSPRKNTVSEIALELLKLALVSSNIKTKINSINKWQFKKLPIFRI